MTVHGGVFAWMCLKLKINFNKQSHWNCATPLLHMVVGDGGGGVDKSKMNDRQDTQGTHREREGEFVSFN